MFRDASSASGNSDRVFPIHVAAASEVIGHIRSLSGSVTAIRASGVAVHVAAGDIVCRGDVIATGADGRVGITFVDGTALNLSAGARIALDEFFCNSDGALNSARFNLSQGTFAFIAGRLAKNGLLSINTPFGTIRGGAQGGVIGTLTLVALTLALIREVEAAPPDLAFVLDDIIAYKDLAHGTFEIVTRDQRVIIIDDPEVTVVINERLEVELVTNSIGQMADLLAASQDAAATYAQGQSDPFTTGTTPGGQRASLGGDIFGDPPGGGGGPPPPLTLVNDTGDPGDGDDGDLPDLPPPPDINAISTGTASLLVEEFDLASGSTPAGADETDSDTGLSFTTGSDPITLSFAPDQDPTISGLDGAVSITWVLAAGDATGRTLLGQIGGVTVITLTLTGDVTAPAGLVTISPTVTAILSDGFPHENAPDADSLTIEGLVVNALDTDGEIVTGTVNVTVEDDAPDAVDDTAQNVAKDFVGTAGGNVLTNDAQGADGATLTHVQLPGDAAFVAISGSPFTVAGLGTYTFAANGAWTFDPVNNQVIPSDATFNYRITDGDGDTDEAEQPITVTDDGDPTGGDQLTLVVEERDLDTTQDPGDLAAGTTTGTTPADTGETDSGTLSFSAGSENLTQLRVRQRGGDQRPGAAGLARDRLGRRRHRHADRQDWRHRRHHPAAVGRPDPGRPQRRHHGDGDADRQLPACAAGGRQHSDRRGDREGLADRRRLRHRPGARARARRSARYLYDGGCDPAAGYGRHADHGHGWSDRVCGPVHVGLWGRRVQGRRQRRRRGRGRDQLCAGGDGWPSGLIDTLTNSAVVLSLGAALSKAAVRSATSLCSRLRSTPAAL